MNSDPQRDTHGAVFDSDRLLALSTLLRKGPTEFESPVQGGSMGSVLPDGSRIRIRFAPQASFMAGQIVTYAAKDRMVAHRLVRLAKWRQEQYLITRGDATVCCDLPVLASSGIGIVTELFASGAWQPPGPAQRRWFGFRWTARATSAVVGGLVRLHPEIAAWMARRIIRIHRLAMRLAGFARRRVVRAAAARTRVQRAS
jgi:hypothetical protein